MSNSEIVTRFMRAWEAKDTDRIIVLRPGCGLSQHADAGDEGG